MLRNATANDQSQGVMTQPELAAASTQGAIATPSSAISSPADLSKCSLLTLPGELRNRIYDFLFQTDERKHLAMLLECTKNNTYRYAMRLSVPGICVLRTCKQIHSEAAARLYCTTKFIASLDLMSAGMCCDNLRMLVGAAASWLDCLGRNIDWLQSLHIDLTSIVLIDSFEDIDVLPLIELVCERLCTGSMPLSFGVRAEEIQEDDTIDFRTDRELDLDATNWLLRHLHTHPMLKTYLRCWRSLDAVTLAIDGSSVEISFRSAARTRVRFDLMQDGQLNIAP